MQIYFKMFEQTKNTFKDTNKKVPFINDVLIENNKVIRPDIGSACSWFI